MEIEIVRVFALGLFTCIGATVFCGVMAIRQWLRERSHEQ